MRKFGVGCLTSKLLGLISLAIGVLSQRLELGTLTKVDVSLPRVVLLEGPYRIRIEILNVAEDHQEPILDFLCVSYEKKWCVLPIFEGEKSIRVTCDSQSCEGVKISLVNQNELEWTPSGVQYLPIEFPREGAALTFKVATKNLLPTGATNQSEYRLRFETDAREQEMVEPGFFRKESNLSMQVTTFPENNHLAREPVEIGSDLVLTLMPGDQNFCIGGDCTYFVRLKSSFSPQVLFSTRAIERVMKSNIGRSGSYDLDVFADQVYKGKDNRYVFNVQQDGDLRFEIEPVEGNPDIYLNFDEDNGFDVSNYQYKSERDNIESILISAHERSSLPKKGKTVYCVVKSDADASYILLTEWRKNDTSSYEESQPIRLNAFYSGALHTGEVKNFVFDIRAEVPETASFFVNLKVRGGNPDLYIKDCDTHEFCSFTSDEISNKKSLYNTIHNTTEGSPQWSAASKSIGNLFLFSDTQTLDDSLYVSLNVVPGGSSQYRETTGKPLPSFPNKLPTSEYNRICIGVVGNQDATSHLSEYTLMASGKSGHSVISEYKSELIVLGAKDEKYYVYSPHSLPDGVKGISLTFEISVGDASFYFSASAKYPGPEFHDEEIEVDNDQTMLQSSVKTLNISLTKLEAEQVYFGFIAKKESLIKVMLSYWLSDPIKGEPMNLIPNAPIYRSIEKASDLMFLGKYDAYTFTVYPVNAKSQAIFLRIHQSSGSLKICAVKLTASGPTQTPSDCTILSSEELLIIPASETANQIKVDWLIFVESTSVQASGERLGKCQYHITLLGGNTAREIVDRRSAVQDVITGDQGNLHYHDFWLNSKDEYLTILVESLDRGYLVANVVYSLKGVSFLDAVVPFVSSAPNKSGGVGMVFNRKQIRPFCEIPTSDEPGRRMLQENSTIELGKENQPLIMLRAGVKCRVYIQISPVPGGETKNLKYRLWVVKEGDRLSLTPGVQYTLPYPGNNTLGLDAKLDSISQGVYCTIMGTYTHLETMGLVQAIRKSDSIVDGNSQKIFTKGLGAQSLSLKSEELDEVNKFSDAKHTLLLTLDINTYKPERETHLIRNTVNWPLDVQHYFNIQVSNQVSILTLGQPVSGVVMRGNFKYFYLQISSTRDATIILNTKGVDDADLYVQKGQSFPDRSSYYLKSINYNSDEVYIPRSNDPKEENKMVWYTIGVAGITASCEFTLTALLDSFKVVNLNIGEIFTTLVTTQSPLVVRHNWSKESGLKAFFYSFDGVVLALTGVEGPQGIKASIPSPSGVTGSDEMYKATDVGTAKEIKLFTKNFTDNTNKLIAFYPEKPEKTATVSVFLYHPYSDIVLKPGQTPLRIVLQNGESVRCSLSVISGELNEMTVKVTGVKKSYTVEYPQNMFKLKQSIEQSANVYLYTFEDINQKDQQDTLRFTVVSKSANNRIGIVIEDSKSLYKLVPGDTNTVLLGTTQADSSRKYYLTLDRNPGINKIKLDMKYKASDKLSQVLTIHREDDFSGDHDEISLVEHIEDGFKIISQDLPVRVGTYAFLLHNPSHTTPVRVSFRFSFNDLKEMEANGVYKGVAKLNHGETIQLMVLEAGSLNISLLTCQSNLVVYLSENSAIGDYDEKNVILTTGGKTESGVMHSFTKFFIEPTSLYLHVLNKGKNDTEYTLVSKFNSGISSPLSEVAVKPGRIFSLDSDRPTKKLYANVEAPIFDVREIRLVYPTATWLRYEVTALLYMPLDTEGDKRDFILSEFKYCWRDIHAKGFHEGSTSVEFTLAKPIGPATVQIPFDFSNDIEEEFKNRDLPVLYRSIARVKTVVAVSYFEEDSFQPLGTTIVMSDAYATRFDELNMNLTSNRNEKWYETAWGIVLVVVLMILVMLLVLVVVYFGADRLSGGYKKVDPIARAELSPSNNDSTTLEMSPMHPSKK